MLAHARRPLSLLLAIAIAAGPVAPAFADPLSRAEYEACQAQDEAAFRKTIQGISVRALKAGIAGVDYHAAVRDQWRRIGMDGIIDTRVDLAVEEVRQQTSWANLLQSLANQQKAQELATAVAERVYRSDAMKGALEQLAVGVGNEIGRQMEFASEDATEPALACLKAFVGARYGETAARAVVGDAGQGITVDPGKGAADISAGSVLKENSGGIAGAAVLLMRRQLANMAGRVGQRIVGAVLARLVAVVAGGVGLVLVAKDIWDLRNGVLPIIATEMKSPDIKAKVQEALADSFSEQISIHVQEIGAATADRIIEIWRDFRNAHAEALNLAERNPQFRTFLDSVPPARMARLDEVIALTLAAEGESGLLHRLDDGTLATAVKSLPDPAMEIARQVRSIDAGLKWSVLAGDQLPKVIALSLYRRTTPDQISQPDLRRLLSLNDQLAIVRLAGIGQADRDTLLQLNDTELTNLARGLTEHELTSLSHYLNGLKDAPRARVLRTVAADPTKIHALASERVRTAIISSADQSAAVEMMLRTNAILDVDAISNDVRMTLDGRTRPILLWEKHPAIVAAFGFLLLVLLLLLRRLFFARPRKSAAA
ncbi:hypothetical protein [Hyphomicrobium sulfonivorans]|uniref:hypothetical protein n=1 Tax=Hyphomicrobium sulfonivorans TaxID=121290 RepID=UPI001FE92106|nr:hypothetical protein [Hyphomicrobium sulfonivorans]